jgi:hypothetical protein
LLVPYDFSSDKVVYQNRPSLGKTNFYIYFLILIVLYLFVYVLTLEGAVARPAKYRLAPGAVVFGVLSALHQFFSASDMAAATADAIGVQSPLLSGRLQP